MAWLPAVAGWGVLAGYALSRPATWHAQAAALLDVTAVLVIAVLAPRLLPVRWPVRLGDVAAPLLLCLLLVTRPVRDAVLAGDLSPCAAALVLYALLARRPRWLLDGHPDGRSMAAAASRSGAHHCERPPRRLLGTRHAASARRARRDAARLLAGRVGLVVAAATVRATRYGRDGQTLLAIGVLGCAVVVTTPVAWSYDLLWLLAAAAGRLARRVEDRAVWPVVATVPALFTSALFDPKIEPVTSFALRNAPGCLRCWSPPSCRSGCAAQRTGG